jgi:hypothetical protein
MTDNKRNESEDIDTLTDEEINDIDSRLGHGKTLAAIQDSDGDTHSIWIGNPRFPVLRVGHSDDDKHEAYNISVRDALALTDEAGLNSTANDLSAQLAEAKRQLAEVSTICNATIGEREALREKLAAREDDLVRAGKLWDITQSALEEATRTIEAETRKSANFLVELKSAHERLENFRKWFLAAGCGVEQLNRIEMDDYIETDFELPREIGAKLDLIGANRTTEALRNDSSGKPAFNYMDIE